MFYELSFYIASALFALGLVYKASTWFRYRVGTQASEVSSLGRILAAAKGIALTLFSLKILTLLKVFVLDVLLQIRVLRESFLRWVMHMCIFVGFMLLLLMHALEKFTVSNLFENYASTLNPFLSLRNIFAFLVVVGLGLALYRRFISKAPRLFSNYMDHYVMIIVALIMVSGFFLEATKIGSYTKYRSMVEDYASTDDEAELRSLESYWVKEFGVVSPNLEGPFDDSVLAEGLELHEMDCASCHSKPQWAPLSYGLARTLKPFAVVLDKAKAHEVFWYIHFLACFIGLAYLPFSKMFHIFTGPLSLLANAVMDDRKSDPANIATKQVMELDACTHCGTCSLQCSVGVCYNEIPNVNILPSEKLGSVKALVAGKKLNEEELRSIQEGLYLCTNCNRCTVVCPVGINLQDLWFNLREVILERGYPEILSLTPLSHYRGMRRDDMEEGHYGKPLEVVKRALEAKCRTMDMYGDVLDIGLSDKELINELRTSLQSNTYSLCFTCTTCTVACPVVRSFDKPVEALDFVPHQIIHAAMLGLGEPIFRSRMLWSCLGCYQCQESCPQGVRVTDVLYKLKNLTMKQLNGKISKS